VATISADGEPVWTNHLSTSGNEHHEDAQWSTHVVDLAGFADDGSVVLAWEMDSGEGTTRGGWTLDDVCLYAPATPDNRLAITDFSASDGEADRVILSWTNGKHAPLARVVVVRKEGGEMPAGPEDGAVVFEDDAPAIGAAASAEDATAEPGHVYGYAVFASDGTDWLSTATEGRNADLGGAAEAEGLGCGCASPGPAGTGAGALVSLLSVARRRRQSVRA
jgi:uncharacterized protein (TIGR03382 family)